MIFRAVFWIGLVSLLAPHEPNLGLGQVHPFGLVQHLASAHLPASAHPGAGTAQASPSTVLSSAASGLSRMGPDCGSACAGGLGVFERLGLGPDGTVAAGLARVKAQIDADIAARQRRTL